MRRRLRHSAAAVAAACLVLGDPSSGTAATPAPAPAATQGVPASLGGLPLTPEDISKTLSGAQRTIAFDQVWLYSLRRTDNYLQATLEIGHFRSGTDWSQAYFQHTVVKLIGSSEPIATRVGADIVYVTTQKGLTIASWFRGDRLVVLSIRSTFREPKTLIRQALDIQP